MTEYEMVECLHWLNGHEFEQDPEDGEGQGSLACCSPRGHKESDTTEQLNNKISQYRLQKDVLKSIQRNKEKRRGRIRIQGMNGKQKNDRLKSEDFSNYNKCKWANYFNKR